MLTDLHPAESLLPTVDVSVVLPCRNEAGHIHEELARVTRALARSDLAYEIVVIDDGSTDSTPDQLAPWGRDSRVTVHTNDTPTGAGAARRLGTELARGSVIVWTDCDLSYPNHLIPTLVATLLADPGIEQVIGARTTEAGSHRHLRRACKSIIRTWIGRRIGHDIPDLNSGMRAFYKASARTTLPLLPPGFSCTSTMTLDFLLSARRVTYLPIGYAPRAGRSKFRPLVDTARLLAQVRRVLDHHRELSAAEVRSNADDEEQRQSRVSGPVRGIDGYLRA